jgi:hypothetical protein
MRSSGELHLPNYNAIWSREFSLLIEDFKDSRARSLDTSDAVIGKALVSDRLLHVVEITFEVALHFLSLLSARHLPALVAKME